MSLLKPPWGSLPDLSHPSSRGLIAEFIMLAGMGDKIYDYSINNNIGAINGAVWGPGSDGLALVYNGISNYSNFGNVFNFGTNPFTIIIGFSLDTVVGKSAQIVTKRQSGAIGDAGFLLGFSAGNAVIFELSSGAVETRLTSTHPLPEVSKVYHYGIVRDDGNSKIVRNGIQSDDGTILTSGNINNSIPFLIGNRGDFSPPLFYGGKNPYLKIYNRPLSNDEIMQDSLDPYARYRRPSPTRYFFIPEGVPAVPNLIDPTQTVISEKNKRIAVISEKNKLTAAISHKNQLTAEITRK